MMLKIKEITDPNDPLIAGIVSMTVEFTDASHIYQRLSFNTDKFHQYVLDHVTDPDAQCCAVHVGDTAVGYSLSFVDDMYIDKPNFEIVTMYSAKEFRGTRVGRMLADNLAEKMDELCCHYGQVSICCAMEKDEHLINQLTANLFKKRGFYEIGVILGRKGKQWDL